MRLLICSLSLWVGIFGCGRESTDPHLDNDLLTDLQNYLERDHRTPEEYIVAQFSDHDLVFVGERHRLKPDVLLIRSLIPLLYDHGVYNLGIEFADYIDQAAIHRLITGEEYDEQVARQIKFNQWPFWGYQDYIDIYKAAWELNRSLPEGARPFRVVGLNCDWDFSHVWSEEDRKNPEITEKVWPNGDSDEYMAGVIRREFLDRGEKALLYMGANHAYTRYRQPHYDVEADSLIRLSDGRAGNRIYELVADRCFNIRLHSPWPSAEDFSHSVLAADGYLDSLITLLAPSRRRAGFDVVGTPFERLPGTTSYWKHGYDDFGLGDYCDGYVILGPLTEYEGVSVAEGFITEENRLAAIAQIANPDPRVKDSSRTVASLMESLYADTEIQRIFRNHVKGYEQRLR
jgi:hypothetical protein